jgi:hypothetical protein
MSNVAVVTIGGSTVTSQIRVGSVQIDDVLNETPNTASFLMDGSAPAVDAEVKIGLGDVTTANLLFAGHIISVRQYYEGQRANPAWEVHCQDYTFLLNQYRPRQVFSTTSASSIVASLIANFSLTFTGTNVQASLPTVSISFDGSEDFSTCLTRLAALVGAYWYVDYAKDLHFFTSESSAAPDTVGDQAGSKLLHDPPIAREEDRSQLRTRVYVRGAGSRLLASLAASETVVPVDSAAIFSATGGQAAIDAQVITYTGVALGDSGSLVGPGVTPSAAPTLAQANGSGITTGAHSYAYTWVTGAGETLPSPLAAITVLGTVSAPTISSVSSGVLSGGPSAGTTLKYAITISNGGGSETAPSSVVTITSTGNRPTISWVITAAMRGNYVTVWRSDDGGSTWSSTTGTASPYASNQSTGGTDTVTDFVVSFTGGTALPTGGTLTIAQVSLTGIAVGPSGVTSRKVYRTLAGLSQLKLLTTIANNTATTYTDSTADGSLGANAPTGDTSGLSQPSGQVAPGSTTLIVASTGFATSGGGWAVIGNGRQIIRYTGISGNTLTGVPASGIGAITAPVNYNSTVTAAPALTGVTGLYAAITAGATVAIFVKRNDLTAQASYGVYEHQIDDDSLLSDVDCAARGDADLALFSHPIVTLTYATRDVKSRSGKTATVSFSGAPSYSGTYKIVRVTIDQIDLAGGRLAPRFTCTVSTVKFSLADLLRRTALAVA